MYTDFTISDALRLALQEPYQVALIGVHQAVVLRVEIGLKRIVGFEAVVPCWRLAIGAISFRGRHCDKWPVVNFDSE